MILASVPIDVDRDEARDAAIRELSDPVYRSAEPSWFDRATGWLLERINELLTGIGSVSPSGIIGLLVLIGLAVLLVVIIRRRIGKIARAQASPPGLFDDRTLTADDHRRAAETAVSQGNLAVAILERFRAIVRELEQRGVLDEVSGRTVDEIATMAGHALPDSAADFRAAAAIFDDVVYGDRTATVDGYGQLVLLDNGIQRRTLLGVSR
jgi:hypothetical protein